MRIDNGVVIMNGSAWMKEIYYEFEGHRNAGRVRNSL